MTAPLANVAAVEAASLPAGPPQGTDGAFVPASGGETAEAQGFASVLGSYVDGESSTSNEGEAPEAQPRTENHDGEGRGETEAGGELPETLEGVADAGLASLPGAETAAAAEVGNAIGSAEEGAAQPRRGSVETGLGAGVARPEEAASQAISEGPPQTNAETALDPSGHTGTPVPDGFVPSEESSLSQAGPFARAATAAMGGNASEPGRPEAAARTDTPDSSTSEIREAEAAALRSDAGDSSSTDTYQPPPSSARGGEPTQAFEPWVSRVEGAARSEGAPLEGAPRALPELPASNENSIVGGARMLANEGGGTARIQLFPPQLGGLELRVTVNQGAVQLSIVADRAAIADLMQHHLPELRHALQLPGLAVERVEIAHRESNLTEGERDTRPHGDGVEREDSSEPREQSGREEEGSPGVESWTGADGLDPISSRGSELQRVTSLGTVDVRA